VNKLLLICLLLLMPLNCLAEVKIIELKHRAAAEVEEQVRSLLDDGEKVTAAGSHLVLIANGESLQAAEQLIAVLDQQQQNLLIRVRMNEERQQAGKDSSAVVSYSNTKELASTGNIDYRIGNSSSAHEQSLQLLEGGRGLIEIGKEIPYTEQWAVVTGEITGYSESIGYKNISTGFWVSPVKILGDKVLVDVEPYISDADVGRGERAPQIDYSQLSTRLQVPLRQWYPLGSQMEQRDKISRSIISWRSEDGQAERDLQIRIDPVE